MLLRTQPLIIDGGPVGGGRQPTPESDTHAWFASDTHKDAGRSPRHAYYPLFDTQKPFCIFVYISFSVLFPPCSTVQGSNWGLIFNRNNARLKGTEFIWAVIYRRSFYKRAVEGYYIISTPRAVIVIIIKVLIRRG